MFFMTLCNVFLYDLSVLSFGEHRRSSIVVVEAAVRVDV